MKETGYGKDVGESWYGMLAPAGTSTEIVDKMAKAIDEAIKSPDALDKLDKGGAKPTYLGPPPCASRSTERKRHVRRHHQARRRAVIPYPLGGPTDITTRIVMDKVGQLLGQSVLFDNKGGASGMIGAACRQDPAGRRLQFPGDDGRHARHHPPPAADPVRPGQGFPPVARMSTSWACLAIHPSVPANTMAEFVAYAKANPGKVNYGSSGNAADHPSQLRDPEPRGRHQDVRSPLQGQRPGVCRAAGRPDPGTDRPDRPAARPGLDGCAGSPSSATGARRVSPTSRP